MEWNKNTNKIAVIDCGVKFNILRLFAERNCECHIFPHAVIPEEILHGNFDGLFISNGPGDPEPCDYAIKAIKYLFHTSIICNQDMIVSAYKIFPLIALTTASDFEWTWSFL